MEPEKIEYLTQLEAKENYTALIKEIKTIISKDKREMTSSFIKQWCAKRWRNIFLNEAVHDEVALNVASKDGFFKKKDVRVDKQKIAERYLKGDVEQAEWKIEMPVCERPDKFKTTLVFAPGLLTGMLPVRAFQTPFPIIEKKLGIRILRSDLHPMRGCEANVQDLVNTIEKGTGFTSDVQPISEDEGTPPEDFFLIGYSKGAPDILTMLTRRPEFKKRIRCIFNWGGAVGGSYLVNDIYKTFKEKEIPLVASTIKKFLIPVFPFINEKGLLRRFDEFDVKSAMCDLTTIERERFLDEHIQKRYWKGN